MKKAFVFVSLLAAVAMLMAACGPAATTQPPATQPPATQPPATQPPATPPPGKILIRWTIGLGTGDNPAQVPIEQEVVSDFNKSQDKIYLVAEVIPNASAQDTVATEIAAGAAGDIQGPVGFSGTNAFPGQWLDIAPYIQSTGYDTSKFEASLTKLFVTEQGTLGLPFAVYPSAVFYDTNLFTEAGLNPLPVKYVSDVPEQYKMPDGTMADWNWDTLAKVAKLLTIDKNGKHSGEAGFDKTNIVQYGFSFAWENKATYYTTYMTTGGSLLVPGGSKGSYQAQIPDSWKQAWTFYYNAIWGAEPWIPNATVASGADFDSGNVFGSGKVAMLENPSWYLCCIGDLIKAGHQFELGAMPIAMNDTKPAGRVDADTFRIWKGTKHPAEAFQVLTYLIDTGINKLVVGSPGKPPAYGAIPSIGTLRQPWVDSMKSQFPFVQNWDTLIAGLNYADVPSAESFLPNFNEAWARTVTFASLMDTNGNIDLNAEIATLQSDLTTIYNK